MEVENGYQVGTVTDVLIQDPIENLNSEFDGTPSGDLDIEEHTYSNITEEIVRLRSNGGTGAQNLRFIHSTDENPWNLLSSPIFQHQLHQL